MTAKNESLQIALATGVKRYLGTICSKHPEINGERNAKSRGCIACNRESMREKRAADPEYYRKATRAAYEKWYPKNKHKVRAAHRQRNTGVDAGTYQRLWEIQEGKCALCRQALNESSPADHCHETKATRGILCGNCNRAEGLIKRSGVEPSEFGRRLTEYLKHPPARKLKEH